MTWTKRLFTIFLIFLGLYMFGDFRINDVNVKDYLRKHVTPQELVALKDQVVRAWQPVYQMLKGSFKADSEKTVKNQDSLARQDKKEEQQLDDISAEDQKKVKELLQKSLFTDDGAEDSFKQAKAIPVSQPKAKTKDVSSQDPKE